MKKIVIVGASSGIGYAVAEAFASRGVKVGVAARRVEKLERLKQEYDDFVEVERIDVCSLDAPASLDRLIKKLGGMDIYFHVAGVGYNNPTMNPEEEVRMVETNATGFARMISTAYNYFSNNNPDGQIVALTSVAGTKGIGQMSAYSASKAFDTAYLEAIRQIINANRQHITITEIRPGWIRTPLLHDDHRYPMEMTLPEVVPQVIRAIVRKKRLAIIDWRWNLLVGLWQLLPHRLWERLHVSPE